MRSRVAAAIGATIPALVGIATAPSGGHTDECVHGPRRQKGEPFDPARRRQSLPDAAFISTR